MNHESSAQPALSTPVPWGRQLRSVLALSLPVIIAHSCRMIMDVTDYWLISLTGDSDALAAILPAQIVMWSFTVIGVGTVSIVTSLASQALGRGDLRTCSACAWQSLYLAAAFGLVGFLLFPLAPQLFALVKHPPPIQGLESRYLEIVMWTVAPTIAGMALSNFFYGVHQPYVATLVAVEGVVVNAAASYVLIFGKLGFAPLGLEGAAWGTVIACHYRLIRLVMALCGPEFHRRFFSRHTWRLDGAKFVNLLRFGGPAGVQWFSDVSVWAFFNLVLVGTFFGKNDMLATGAAWQYMRVAFMPCNGAGMALAAMVGKAIGGGDCGQAKRVARIASQALMGYMGLVSLAFLVWRRELIAFFEADPSVVEIGAQVMICAAVFNLFDGVGISYSAALRGAGDTFIPALVFIASHWLIVVGGGYLIATLFPQWGCVGPWLAASLLIIVTGVFQWWRWRQGAWMKIDIFRSRRDSGPDGDTIPAAPEPVDRATAL